MQSTKDDKWKLTLESHSLNKTNEFIHKIIEFKDAICIDQTGKFSCGPFKGKNCVFVTYSHGNNPILVRLLKSKKGHELTLALEEIYLCVETQALDTSVMF